MPDNNELFGGLDSLIFDQPSTIDVSSFNKAEDKTPPVVEDVLVEDKKVDPKKAVDVEADKLDPTDFFKNIKEVSDEAGSEDKKEVSDVNTQEEVLKTWVGYFKENNLLMDNDLKGFDGSMETLIEAFQVRENRVGLEMVDDYKTQMPPELKFLADNWEEGVPLNQLIDIRSNKLKYSLITDEKLEESVDTQKAVKTEYLRRTTRYSETKIEKEITRLLDLGELEGESKEDLVELKKLEDAAEDNLRRETKKEQEYRKNENHKVIKSYEKYVSETKEIIPGVKIAEKEQADILNKIINPIGIDTYGNPVSYITSLRNEDPIRFDTAVTYIASITKGFTDWGRVMKAGENKATKALESAINISAPKSVKDGIKTSGKESLLDMLAHNKGIFGK